jgi:hypothetical protein
MRTALRPVPLSFRRKPESSSLDEVVGWRFSRERWCLLDPGFRRDDNECVGGPIFREVRQ